MGKKTKWTRLNGDTASNISWIYSFNFFLCLAFWYWCGLHQINFGHKIFTLFRESTELSESREMLLNKFPPQYHTWWKKSEIFVELFLWILFSYWQAHYLKYCIQPQFIHILSTELTQTRSEANPLTPYHWEENLPSFGNHTNPK